MDARRLFGTSGIRGVVDQDLSPDFCRRVALAIGTTLPQSSSVCIATDTRISRDVIKEAITTGLLSCGVNVVDLGILPTPALALLTRESGFAAGIMVTASHNPPEFNGIKLFTKNSLGYSQAQEIEIERVYFDQKFRQGKKGTWEQAQDMKQRYLSSVKGKLALPGSNRHPKVVIDPGNGAASGFASDIFVQMGFNVVPVNDEPDGLFPGRSPEPKEDTLQGTLDFLRQHNADLAICFDGDADRVVFCDKEGFLGFNEPIAFISRLAVKKTGKKKVATTVETGTLLDLAVKDLGVQVFRGRVGDVAVAHLAQQLDAALGVEQVGVYIMPEVGYYPDSIFASLFLISQLSDVGEIRQFFQGIPRLFFEKAKVSCPNEFKESVMVRAKEKAHLFASEEINTLDGLRLQFADSWLLIRASGTEPVIRVISESTSQKQTDQLIGKGKELVQSLVEADK
ncbi:MAG: phosphoglucosamine mutase [Dehalococcoidia bacterium]|nr:phosphoglucosamine mutase [Dehalococcoidia bacterium]MDH4299611.1 phosphoglucosamine mutase [Dehalococcoidia bacterium]MDH4367028.1 phosphoglucosamine mutase [Dehalococcoidia bacterium]